MEVPGDDEECVPGPVMTPETYQHEWKATVDEWTGQESVRAAGSARAGHLARGPSTVFRSQRGGGPHVSPAARLPWNIHVTRSAAPHARPQRA